MSGFSYYSTNPMGHLSGAGGSASISAMESAIWAMLRS